MRKGLFVEQVPFLTLHRRVANHSGGASHQCERLVSAVLEVLEYHYADEMADVKGVSGRVYSHISSGRALHQFLLGSRHDVVYHSSPAQFFNKILHRLYVFLVYDVNIGLFILCATRQS